MPSRGFPKAQRLRKRREYLLVQEGSSRIVLPSCLVLMAARGDDLPARLGITVTRKFGNAVQRNRAKRVMREVFRRSPQLFPPGIDFVVIPKAPAVRSLSFAQLLDEWQRATRLIVMRADSLRRALAKSGDPTQTAGPRGPAR